ncbi:hypothetical protein NE626_16020, partial [Intestinimonas massiliensis]|uniref:hypothetical protein n=1 Tax=Intestinimonas massiliensis (ex Afouda et al. 2020) TaxID=1673721 RepID=UPI00210DCECA
RLHQKAVEEYALESTVRRQLDIYEIILRRQQRQKPDIRYKDPAPLEGLPAVQRAILDNVSAWNLFPPRRSPRRGRGPCRYYSIFC